MADSTDAPWALLAAGITPETPAIFDGGGAPGGGSGEAGMPVRGFFYYHPDHLGGTAMLSDSQGQFVTGVDVSTGQSHVDYMPYGEIDRKDSDGPDIFRYKFSGQIEDANTGFYYYRARYYDPVIGRFTQADAFADAMQPMGMNRYMYTVGNPVRYRDPSGHVNVLHMLGEIIKHAVGGVTWAAKGIAGGARWAARGADGAAREVASGGAFSRNQGGVTIKQAVGAIVGISVGVGLVAAGAALTATGIGAIVGIPLMAAGVGVLYGGLTHGRAFYDRPLRAIGSYALGGLDFGLSFIINPINGDPAPFVKHGPGGAEIYNSGFSNLVSANAFNSGFVSHLDTGSSRATLLHERGHSRQRSGNDFFLGTEIEADLKAGVLRYLDNEFASYLVLIHILDAANPELFNLLLLFNLTIVTALDEFLTYLFLLTAPYPLRRRR